MFPIRRCRLVNRNGQLYALPLMEADDAQELAVTRAEAKLIRALDGKTDPHDLDGCLLTDIEISRLLRHLKQRDLIAVGRLRVRPLSVLYTLWFAGKRVSGRMRMACLIVTLLLAVCCIPAFVIGVLTVRRAMGFSPLWTGDLSWGLISGVGAGLLFHEIGHIWSCYGFGGKCFGAGIGLMLLLPCAYVDLEISNIRSRAARAEIHLAGIQANLALSGTAFWMTQFGCGWFWYGFALQNAVLATLNLCSFYAGIDGAKVLRLLLGIESDSILDLLFDRRKRFRLRRKGPLGRACAVTVGILAASNIGLVFLVILEIRMVFL